MECLTWCVLDPVGLCVCSCGVLECGLPCLYMIDDWYTFHFLDRSSGSLLTRCEKHDYLVLALKKIF